MIKAILVFNNQGKPRLMKFFVHYVSVCGRERPIRPAILITAPPERG